MADQSLAERWSRIDKLQKRFGFNIEEALFVVNHWDQLRMALGCELTKAEHDLVLGLRNHTASKPAAQVINGRYVVRLIKAIDRITGKEPT